MVDTRKLDKASARNAGGHFASTLHIDSLVARPVDHESWHSDCRKNTANIDLTVHAHESGDGGRAGPEPFVATPPALKRRVICARGCESL